MPECDASPQLHVSLRVQRLRPGALLPEYQTAGAAGMDLCACLHDQSLTVAPGAIVKVPTGIALALPEGFEGQVRPRSGLSSKHGVTVVNSPGTIDSDYRGEILVALINLGREAFVITHAMRIAQLVIAPVARATLHEALSLDDTARGHGGFGSTGA